MDERPAPAPDKLLGQFRDWTSGEELPGRTMSYLKTGFLPEVLAEQDAEETEGVAAMLESWAGWEEGTTNPTAVLEALRDHGLEEFLAGLAGS